MRKWGCIAAMIWSLFVWAIIYHLIKQLWS